MRSKITTSTFHPENLASREKPGVPGIPAASKHDRDKPESAMPDKRGQDVTFTIVDDPKNESVYKGPGSYAATRAESAVRAVERVPPSVENAAFLVVLSKALASTGTRLAPIVGELCKSSPVTSGGRA